VNADVSPSDLQVALLDADGHPLDGFSYEQSVTERHDKLRYRIRWRSKDEPKSLLDVPIGKPVALQFRLRNGDLFAFQLVE
jgi:hypothetical protein